jgi:hypothetical protein
MFFLFIADYYNLFLFIGVFQLHWDMFVCHHALFYSVAFDMFTLFKEVKFLLLIMGGYFEKRLK